MAGMAPAFALSARAADQTGRLMVVMALAAVGAVAIRARPRLAVLLWLGTVCFIPIWLGVNLGQYYQPAQIVAMFIIIVLFPRLRSRFGGADLVVLLFAAVSLIPVILGTGSRATASVLLLQWLVAFMLGRILPQRIDIQWVYGAIGIFFTAVGILAIAEFFTSYNPFVKIAASNRLYEIWGMLQNRGGFIRAEGAFGHSIALGSCLALSIAPTLASRFNLAVRAGMVLVMVSATVVTFSRISMVCAVLSVVVSVLFLPDRMSFRVRVCLVSGMAVVGITVASFVTRTFEAAGSEATNSAAYRGNLTTLIPDMAPLGLSSIASRTSTGELYFGRFRSIDSEIILLGLTYGWIPLVIALTLLFAAAVAVILRRVNPPAVAIIGQIPALATVALITQYEMYFWFMAGLCAFAYSNHEAKSRLSNGFTHPYHETNMFLGPTVERVSTPSEPSRLERPGRISDERLY